MFTNRISKFFIVVLVLVAALSTVSFASHAATTGANRSYHAVEQMRLDRSHAASVLSAGYDNIEAVRIQRGAASLGANAGYDAVEQMRAERPSIESKNLTLREYQLGERYGVTLKDIANKQTAREYWLGERYGQTLITDRSYDQVEAIRAHR